MTIKTNTAVFIPHSQVIEFNKNPVAKGLRWGQAFYDYMKMDKVTNPDYRAWADKLYNASDKEAKVMVTQVTDYSC